MNHRKEVLEHSGVAGGRSGSLPSSNFQFGEYGQYNRGGTEFVLVSLGRHRVDHLFVMSQLWENIW